MSSAAVRAAAVRRVVWERLGTGVKPSKKKAFRGVVVGADADLGMNIAWNRVGTA